MFPGIIVAHLACFTLVLLDVSSVNAQRANTETLRFVHTFWRHGDRTPAQETFPSDTGNRAETWPEGLGELTMIGIRQHYELGKYLRQRYDGYLPRRYRASEIYVQSTSYNRAIMSAAANMAGLYEPEGDQIWNNNIHWQPVPIQVIPKENDPMLWTNRPCPVATQLFEDYKNNSPEMRRIEQKYSRLLTFLGEKTGINRTLRLYDDVFETFDPLNCQHWHNDTHRWPAWMNMSLFTELTEVYETTGRMMFPTLELQRFRGGLILGDMLSRMRNQTLQNQNKTLKLYAYSSHDTTMTAFLNNLGALQPHSPPYAALLMVELHQINNQYFVEVYYRNDTTRDAYAIEIGECPRPCSLNQFAARSESRIPRDWYKECGTDEFRSEKPQQTTSLSTVFDAFGTLLKKIFVPNTPFKQ